MHRKLSETKNTMTRTHTLYCVCTVRGTVHYGTVLGVGLHEISELLLEIAHILTFQVSNAVLLSLLCKYLKMPSYLTVREREKKENFFCFFSLLFVTIIVVDAADAASGGYLVCSVYAPLTTSLHNMMLQPIASGIYDSTFEFSTEILLEAVGRRCWY